MKKKKSIRVLFQNVDGLELFITGQTLEETSNAMQKYNIDVAYLAETNINWNHSKARKKIYKILRCFWNRRKLTTAMSLVPCIKICKPRRVLILANPLIFSSIINEQ